MKKKNIFAIVGSASRNSSNQKLVDNIAKMTMDDFNITVYSDLKRLPHFDPELSIENTPQEVLDFRENVNQADAILICTPEYVFSIPSGLKNVIEWCIAVTVFTDKPIGIITASANGEKGHEELQLIMRTLMTKFTEETTLLIQGIKGKINEEGEITNSDTLAQLKKFIEAFKLQIETH
jgi:NAD(P)H-dependent FMN reductase